jgi:hypothetical protein
METRVKTALGVMIIVILTITIGIFVWQAKKKIEKPIQPEGQQCTMEAKVCLDGSSVGRTRPNCEFAPCPVGNKNTVDTDSIILEKAVVIHRKPGENYFPPYIKEYQEEIIKKGEEFAIEGFPENTSMIIILKLKLIDIKSDYLIVDVLYDYGIPSVRKNIKDGDFIDADPNMLDAIEGFDFNVQKENDKIVLSYKASGMSTMPPAPK